ncbi:Ppx/GppA phosphatase family protein [uncultured Mailhella sp.]|uniref:Ppx/GppA phosphatase family protein n=1 Tax=uncultured Mailhella sp. TaxID=1981031 RepID=UPI0025D76337|nr:Ppx/GppA phosphatase family protein [uncultured Mailhella sp.]
MSSEAPFSGVRTVAIMDLGSNSLRMMIVRIGENRVTSVLNQVKQMVRLGEGAFEEHRLQPEPMRRTIAALRGFAGMCRSYGVDEVVALATAAVRDAENGQEFMDEIRRETGIDFTVISGREEARLICRGVSVALEPFAGKRMFIDIGGGSTELSVASGGNILELESLKLGAVRLAGLFPCAGTVSPQRYAEMQKYVRDHAVLPLQRMEAQGPGELVGSSGTIQSLAEMAVAMERESGRRTGDTTELLSYSSLRRVVRALCERNEEDRMSLPGMNPRRTGILIPGAAILQTIMEELDFDSVRVSGRGLRDGALADYLDRLFPEKGRLSVRDESVLRLARLCRFEEVHSRHVAKLALMLFDSARELGLYRGPARMRELLHYAAMLHDIGIFISFTKHNVHSHYLIQNSEMLGFTQKEVSLMAALALYHRYGYSKKDKGCVVTLAEDWLVHARCLSLFLSLAEGMDKSHRQAVVSAKFVRKDQNLALLVRASVPCPVEQERLKRCYKSLEKCFGRTDVVWESAS